MTSSAASLSRILSGARLVASAAGRQAGAETSVIFERATKHGMDVSSKIDANAQDLVFNLAQEINKVNMETSFTRTGPNPYESQLHPVESTIDANGTSASVHATPFEKDAAASSNIPQTTNTIPEDQTNLYLIHAQQASATTSEAMNSSLGSSSTDTIDAAALGSKSKSRQDGTSGSTAAASRDIQSNLRNESTSNEGDATLLPPKLKEGEAIPSSRISRAFGFASLGFGLAMGSASEVASRVFTGSSSSSGSSGSIVANDANSDRLAATLCRMRGAALKLGQMLSIQDESLLPPALTKALKQVRQGADSIPKSQLFQQLESTLGPDWRDMFESFEEIPIAAASIGQVHRATIHDDDGNLRNVVVKVQYPGVAQSIESDLRNLTMLVSLSGMVPKGLFIENVIRVGRDELKVECNYLNEMANQNKMRELVRNDPVLQRENFRVPEVFASHTLDEVLTTEFVAGGTIDRVTQMDQDERNRIGRTILYLTMKELFEWRLMQTDPNWGNFLYDPATRQTSLIDFGATRSYGKDFVDGYLRIVWANANRDEDTLMDMSQRLGFLTGDENEEMMEAHKQSGFTVGEPFWSDEPFDFRGSKISSRMRGNMSTFLKHRLTPPPEEVYTLHRKLAGAYMLCIKLGAIVRSRDLLEDIVANHNFEDGLPHPMQQ